MKLGLDAIELANALHPVLSRIALTVNICQVCMGRSDYFWRSEDIARFLLSGVNYKSAMTVSLNGRLDRLNVV